MRVSGTKIDQRETQIHQASVAAGEALRRAWNCSLLRFRSLVVEMKLLWKIGLVV